MLYYVCSRAAWSNVEAKIMSRTTKIINGKTSYYSEEFNLLELNKFGKVMAEYKQKALNSLKKIAKSPETSDSRKTLCSILLKHAQSIL